MDVRPGCRGDASPAGSFGSFARMEWIAEAAAERIVALYDSIELSDEPVTLEHGVTHDVRFEQWANKVWNYGLGLDLEQA